MIKTSWFSLLCYNRFEYGEQVVSQFVLFELKLLFSVLFFYFHRSLGQQDRFHTHAFNGLSVRLFGRYDEHLLLDEQTGEYVVLQRRRVLQYFPRERYHRIAKSTGCLTVLISGPWHGGWKEWKDGRVTLYSWGRRKSISKQIK